MTTQITTQNNVSVQNIDLIEQLNLGLSIFVSKAKSKKVTCVTIKTAKEEFYLPMASLIHLVNNGIPLTKVMSAKATMIIKGIEYNYQDAKSAIALIQKDKKLKAYLTEKGVTMPEIVENITEVREISMEVQAVEVLEA